MHEASERPEHEEVVQLVEAVLFLHDGEAGQVPGEPKGIGAARAVADVRLKVIGGGEETVVTDRLVRILACVVQVQLDEPAKHGLVIICQLSQLQGHRSISRMVGPHRTLDYGRGKPVPSSYRDFFHISWTVVATHEEMDG